MLINAHGLFGSPPRNVIARLDTLVRFGVFTLDRATGELTREGRRVPLQDQPARVLAYLVAHHGQLVTRDELRRLLWPDGTFVDFNTGLHVSISKIRNALGDSATRPRFIETLPKRGYRFVAPVLHEATLGDTAVAPTLGGRVLKALVRVWKRFVAPHE